MSEQKIVFLTDGTVTLRPVLKKDTQFALASINDPNVRPNLAFSFLPTMEVNQEEWIERMAKNRETDITFAIEVSEKLIGFMGLHEIKWKDRLAKTGAMIKELEHRGKGYGTRAKMLLLHYAFNECNLRKITSGALAHNFASINFNKKCGYKIEGCLKKHAFVNGQYVDIVISAVFAEDFFPLWEEHKKKYNISL